MDERELEQALVTVQSLQLTSQVVGNLAHGVSNALTKLIGYVELLSDEGLGETERRELLQMAAVDEEAVYAARQLLGFARRLRATWDEVDVNELIGEVLGLMHRSCEKQGVMVLEEFDPALEAIAGHAGQLQLLLLHLIANSLEAFARSGRGQVVQIRTKGEGARVIIEVEDDGPGMTEEELEAVFALDATAQESGSGLGLCTCRQIARNHGGDLRLVRGAEEGLCVIVELALQRQSG
jgi:two-component system sensor histidine kinase HydH